MANYKSIYTGEEIDAGIAKANTAIQEHQDISGKVDKVNGKGLSSNDFTNEEKAKLDNIDMSEKQDTLVSGTNIKTINGNSVLGSGNLVIEGGEEGLSSVAHDETLTGAGTNETPLGVDTTKIATKSDLNGKQATIDSSHKLSSDLVDDTNKTNKFVTSSEKTNWSGKQDQLISGTNIKTINNTSLLGSGNIDIQGGGTSLPISFSTTQPPLDGSVVLWVNAEGEEQIEFGVTGYNCIGDCQDIEVTDQTDINPRQYNVYADGQASPYNIVGIKKGSNYISKIEIAPNMLGEIVAVGYMPNATGTQLAALIVYAPTGQKLGFRLPKNGSQTAQRQINPTVTGSLSSTNAPYIIETKNVSGDIVVTFTNKSTQVVDMTFTWAELGSIYTPAFGFGRNTSGVINRTFKIVE